MDKIKKHKKLVIGLAILVMALIIIITRLFGKKQASQYQTSKVERGTIISSVSASGQVLSANYVTVNTQASGTVKQIFVKDGQIVKKGDKIMEISLDGQGLQRNTQAWSSYLSAKNSLDAAQASAYSLQSDMFSKWKTFYGTATNGTYQNGDGTPNETNRALAEFHISQDDWLAAEAKYKIQQNVITQAQVALNSAWTSYQLSSATVTAPVDGTLANLVVVDGMIINNSQTSSTTTTSSQQIAVIQNQANPLASFNLSEIDVSQVKPDQKATVTFDSLVGKTFTGKVMTVDRIGAVASGVTSYPMIVQLDTTVPQILPNMAATAKVIITSKDNVLLIPTTATQTVGDQIYARVLKNGQEQQVLITTGLTSDTQTEIVSGLKEGDVVITGVTSNTTSTTQTSPFGGGFGGNRTGGNAFRLGR